MIYVAGYDPILVSFKNPSFSTVSSVVLNTSADVELTTVTSILDTTLTDGSKEWYAVFDPSHFSEEGSYKLVWSGLDTNSSTISFIEDGIQIRYTRDFYSSFLEAVRLSMMDDGEVCDYHPVSLVQSVKHAASYFNTQPPITNFHPEDIPFNLLLDYSKIYLYRAKASRETMNTFTYSDIGKSFNLDRAPKLLQLVDNLSRQSDQQLNTFKKQLRPAIKGLMSRYARRSATTARSMMMSRTIYRNFVR